MRRQRVNKLCRFGNVVHHPSFTFPLSLALPFYDSPGRSMRLICLSVCLSLLFLLACCTRMDRAATTTDALPPLPPLPPCPLVETCLVLSVAQATNGPSKLATVQRGKTKQRTPLCLLLRPQNVRSEAPGRKCPDNYNNKSKLPLLGVHIHQPTVA